MNRNVSNAAGLVQFDHRLVDGDVEAAVADAGVDYAKAPGHGVSPGRPGS
jgi:hypothetical protein